MTTMPPILRVVPVLMLAAACLGSSPAAYAESTSSRMHGPPPQAIQDAAEQRARRLADRALKAAPAGALNDKSTVAAQVACPPTTASWVTWRSEKVQTLLAPVARLQDERGPFLDSDAVMDRAGEAFDYITRCITDEKGEAAAVVKHLRMFVGWQSVSTADAHMFGHGPEVTDDEYLKRITLITDLPCLLKSAEFKASIRYKTTYRDAWDMVARQNLGETVADCPPEKLQWIPLIYQSAFLGTPDAADAFGRFLVVVPGTAYDRWIQFGIWTPGEKAKGDINNVSVVAALNDKQPAMLPTSAAVDWWRVYGRAGKVRLGTRRHVEDVSGNCQLCHKTPVIGIHPKEVFEFAGTSRLLTPMRSGPGRDDLLAKFNSRIDKYAAPTQVTGPDDTFANADNYGPPLGPDITRDPNFLKSCTAPYRLLQPSIDRVAASMNCVDCHTNRDRGAINFPMATQRTTATKLTATAWPNLVRAYVTQGWMPPPEAGTPALTLVERKALFNCLTLEYHDPQKRTGLLADWLNQTPKKLALRPQDTPMLMARASSTAAKARPLATPQDNPVPPLDGKTDFEARCARCHSTLVGVNKRGPSMFGVVGRASGATTFSYSASYLEAGKPEVSVVWDEANLMQFLIDDSAFLTLKLGHADTSKMNKQFVDEPLRRRIVDYLTTLK